MRVTKKELGLAVVASVVSVAIWVASKNHRRTLKNLSQIDRYIHKRTVKMHNRMNEIHAATTKAVECMEHWDTKHLSMFNRLGNIEKRVANLDKEKLSNLEGRMKTMINDVHNIKKITNVPEVVGRMKEWVNAHERLDAWEEDLLPMKDWIKKEGHHVEVLPYLHKKMEDIEKWISEHDLLPYVPPQDIHNSLQGIEYRIKELEEWAEKHSRAGEHLLDTSYPPLTEEEHFEQVRKNEEESDRIHRELCDECPALDVKEDK